MLFVTGRVLQRKWKSLRDCYSRECQRLSKTKSRSAASRKSPYMYYMHLSFLSPIIKSKSNTGNSKELPAGETVDDFSKPMSPPPEPRIVKTGKKRKLKNVSRDVKDIVNILTASMNTRDDKETVRENDSDRLFLLSLLQPLQEIPEYLRFSVKMEMMQVIERARCGTTSSSAGPSKFYHTSVQQQSYQQQNLHRSSPFPSSPDTRLSAASDYLEKSDM